MASTPERDLYHRWLGIPPKDQPPHYYRLLGVELFESDADVISMAADQRMTHLRTFQTGADSAHSQRLLNEVAAARVTLLNPAKKASYDAQLRANLHVQQPFVQAAAPVAVSESVQDDFTGEYTAPTGAGKRRQAASAGGMKAYTLIVLGVGIVGLASILWLRAKHWQIQLVEADQPAAGSATNAKANPTADNDKPARLDRPNPRRAPHADPVADSRSAKDAGAPGKAGIAQGIGVPGMHHPPAPAPAAPAAPPGSALPGTGEPSAAPAPQPDYDLARTRWVHAQGSFQRGDDETWVEVDDNTRRIFTEVERTPLYIKIHRVQAEANDPEMWVKLEPTRSLFRSKTGAWKILYRGGWKASDSGEPGAPPVAGFGAALGSAVSSNSAGGGNTPDDSEWEFDKSNGPKSASFSRVKLLPTVYLDQSLVDLSQNTIGQMVPVGAEVFTRTSGSQMTGAFSSVHGKLEGPAVELFSKTQMELFARYDDGKRQGDFRLWDDRGRRLLFSQYKKGSKNGITCVFRNGLPRYVELTLIKGEPQEYLVRFPAGSEPTVTARSDFNADDSREFVQARARLSTLEAQLMDHERTYKSEFADWWENVKRQRAIALGPQKRANIAARGKQIDAQNAAIFNSMQRAGAGALGR